MRAALVVGALAALVLAAGAQESRAISGRVVWPADVPGGERAFAVLRGVRADDAPHAEWSELDRSPVAQDGAFRLEAPADLRTGAIELDARFVFCASPFELRAEAPLPASVQLEPRLGGLLRVELVPSADSELDPRVLVGRELALYRGRGGAARVAAIGPGPAIELGGLAPDHAYELAPLRADALAPFAPVRLADLRIDPGRVLEVRLPVPDGLLVAGRVVDERGRPVAGADVTVSWGGPLDAGGSWSAGDRVRTDADGRFAFAGVHPLLRTIRATAPACRPVERALWRGAALDDVELVLRRGAALAGNVRVPDGRPVEGATVALVDDGGEEVQSVATDRHGRFAFEGVDAGVRHVVAHAAFDVAPAEQSGEVVDAGERRGPRWRAWSDAARAGGAELALVLAAPPGLRGIVVDDAGAPASGFALTAAADFGQPAQSPTSRAEHHASFASDDGRFDWAELPVGRWLVVATADGCSPSQPVRVELPRDDDVRFVLARGGSIAGRVVDPGGAPVAGARVEPSELRGSVAWSIGGHDVWSDAQGRFVLADLAPGRYRLVASVPSGSAPSAPVDVELRPGERRAGVELALRRGGRIAARVLDRAGRPLVRSRVSVSDGAGSRLVRRGDTDANGALVLDAVPPGPALVTCVAGTETLSALVDVVAGATVDVVLGGVPAAAVVVRGHVASAGEPLAGAWVAAEAARSVASSSSTEPDRPEAVTRTAADGSFSLELLAGGETSFVVHPLGGRRVAFVEHVPASGEHEVRFVLPTGGLRGRVVAPGEPGELGIRTRVLVRRELDGGVPWSGELESEVHVDPQTGAWSCLHLDPGTYTLLAGRGPRYVALSLAPDETNGAALRSGLVVRAGEVREGIELELRRGGAIEGVVTGGVVTGGAGRPLDALVHVRLAEGRPLQLVGHPTREAGRFHVGALPPGELLVEAFGDGLATAEPARVDVRAGEATALTLDLVPATSLALRVDGSGTAPADLAVSIRDARGLEHAHRRLPAGDRGDAWRVFGPLAPGVYTVTITAPTITAPTITAPTITASDGRRVGAEVALAGEPERALVLVLE